MDTAGQPGVSTVVDDSGGAAPAPAAAKPAPRAAQGRDPETGRYLGAPDMEPARGRGFEPVPTRPRVSFEQEMAAPSAAEPAGEPMATEPEEEGRGSKRKAAEEPPAAAPEEARIGKERLDALLENERETKRLRAMLNEERKRKDQLFEDFNVDDEASLKTMAERLKKDKQERDNERAQEHRTMVTRFLGNLSARLPKLQEVYNNLSESDKAKMGPALEDLQTMGSEPSKLYSEPSFFQGATKNFNLVDTVASALEAREARSVGRVSEAESELKTEREKANEMKNSYSKMLAREKAREKALIGSGADPANRGTYTGSGTPQKTPAPAAAPPASEAKLAEEYAFKALPTNQALVSSETRRREHIEKLNCPYEFDSWHHQDPFKFYRPGQRMWGDINAAMDGGMSPGNSMRFSVPGMVNYDYGKEQYVLSDSELASEQVYTLASRKVLRV